MADVSRVVSLVPSLTETVAVLGRADRLVGVTTYCTHGAPESVARVGGTKNPDVERIVALAPDLVLANTEENRTLDLDALRAAGLHVLETFPRTAADVPAMLRDVGEAVGADAGPLAAEVEAALATAAGIGDSDGERVMALTLIWRKPWMGVGPDTYVDDLLWRAGFGNVLSGFGERYPRLDPSLVLGADVVLLPSEPYAFTDADLPAVADLVGDVPARFVDGQLLTWHGQRTAEAIRTLSALAAELRR